MRWSSSFHPTLRDDPADAEAVSHKLLVRAGFIRQLSSGVYTLLPLGLHRFQVRAEDDRGQFVPLSDFLPLPAVVIQTMPTGVARFKRCHSKHSKKLRPPKGL